MSNLLSRNDDPSKKLKEELFGKTVILEASDMYTHIAMLRELNMLHLMNDWEDLDVHVRAKILAQYQLNAMVEVLRRHDQIMEQREQKMKQKAAKKK